ncbi:hypothetical protein [Streptomyces sp. NPDC086989]
MRAPSVAERALPARRPSVLVAPAGEHPEHAVPRAAPGGPAGGGAL